MGLRIGNTDRLQSVFFIDRVGNPAVFGGRPVHGLIGEFDAFGLDGRGRGGICGSGAREVSANGPGRCGGYRGCRWRERRSLARWNLRLNPAKQRGEVRRGAWQRGKRCPIVGRQLVDDRQPRVDGRAVFGIDRAVDRGSKHHAAMFLKADESVAPRWPVGAEVGAGDRH